MMIPSFLITHILGTYDNDSHLAQVILLDEHVVDHIASARSRREDAVEVSFRHKAPGLCMLCIGGAIYLTRIHRKRSFKVPSMSSRLVCGRASPCPRCSASRRLELPDGR